MDVNACKAEIRRLQLENQNLRKRTHKTIHDQQARIRQLEAQVAQEPWTYLPLYDMDTVKELARG